MARKIEKLINDPELRECFAENAFLCMDEFRIDKIVGQWKEVLKPL